MAETVLDTKKKPAELEVDWIRQSQPMTNGQTTAMVGQFFSLGGIAGIVQRMVVLPSGVVRVTLRTEEQTERSLLLWPTGMEGRVP